MESLRLTLQVNPTIVFTYLFFGITLILAFLLYNKIRMLQLYQKRNKTLEEEIRELDHQARLIIKSDMKLKLYQEEIEDKLKKLTSLGDLIRASTNILDKDELLSKLDEEFINNLGFKKAAIFVQPQGEAKWTINLTPAETELFRQITTQKKDLFSTLSVVSSDYLEDDESLTQLFAGLRAKDFLFAPIHMGANVFAIFLLNKCILPSGITQAEKESFFIVSRYLGQCLDNIKLFEALYHAGEELETKVKEKTFQLTRSLTEIKEISKMKSEFISGVSHELRTPLTSIKGFSSLLIAEKFGALPPEAKKRLERIDQNVNKLVDMVNTLLDISRIESRRMEVKIAQADLIPLIKDVSELLLPQITQKHIEFSSEIPESLMVYMDRNLIERVFINIINNAIKFTPENGKIMIKCKPKDDYAIISIKDTGCGMEKHDLEKIFQEFYRTQSAKGIQGTGLGLSLVKKIIETHNEKIWVESEINKGTSFCFTLKTSQ
jgi:signal transduction histidine kinase